ncbi:MAG TPA: FtsQ-type POTRA domain-containing protein, partial [Candidatus Caenarcaniphilales bacterium]
MTNIVQDTHSGPVLERRRHLRYQRRLKLLQAGWRTLCVVSLTGGLAWAVIQPDWMIRQPGQVAIQGNRLMSSQAIEALLPFSLPQSLIGLQPKQIIDALKAKAPIEDVTVVRQLFPPRLTVSVQERDPVAVVNCLALGLSGNDIRTPLERFSKPTLSEQNLKNTWLLDSQGIIMPLESYPALQKSRQLPSLTVTGMIDLNTCHQVLNNQPLDQNDVGSQHSSRKLKQSQILVDKQKQSQWPSLYRALSHSPIKVFELDWQDTDNLVLKTELGIVH